MSVRPWIQHQLVIFHDLTAEVFRFVLSRQFVSMGLTITPVRALDILYASQTSAVSTPSTVPSLRQTIEISDTAERKHLFGLYCQHDVPELPKVS